MTPKGKVKRRTYFRYRSVAGVPLCYRSVAGVTRAIPHTTSVSLRGGAADAAIFSLRETEYSGVRLPRRRIARKSKIAALRRKAARSQ
jgi:hypothetical protein